MGERLTVWTRTLQDQGWQNQVDRLRAGSGEPPTPPGQIPPAFRRPAPQVTPRPLDQVAEDVIKAFDNVGDFAGSPQAVQAVQGVGANRLGTMTLILSKAGLLSCDADPNWVSGQTAATLMNALGEALIDARVNLENSAAAAARSGVPGSLDRLFAEAFAFLADTRHDDS